MITSDVTAKIDTVSLDIWSSMVNIPLKLKGTASPKTVRTGKAVMSSVQIIGTWNGAVCLEMDSHLARNATAALVGLTPDELSNEDVRDAAGELANMTAGGVKELMPPPCQISLPTVVMGTDFELSVPQGVVVYCSDFESEFGTFTVTLVEGDSKF